VLNMGKKTKLQLAIKAAQECAKSKDLLNCRPCRKNFANEHSCVLNENVRLEYIKSFERRLRGVSRIEDEAILFCYPIEWWHGVDQDIKKETGNGYANEREFIATMQKERDYLKSFDFRGEIKQKRGRME
jgi:hypothetical protein